MGTPLPTTFRVVLNTCYGGFGLSRSAVLLARALGFSTLGIEGGTDLLTLGDHVAVSTKERTHPALVQAVELLGAARASGESAELAIQEVRLSLSVENDDGLETGRVFIEREFGVPVEPPTPPLADLRERLAGIGGLGPEVVTRIMEAASVEDARQNARNAQRRGR